MRILDNENDKASSDILLLLTPVEARWLMNDIQHCLDALAKGDNAYHTHLNDWESSKEITLGLITDETIPRYCDRVVKLIREDK